MGGAGALLRGFAELSRIGPAITNEPNAIRRAAMRKPDPFDWEDRIVALTATSGRFNNWHGTLRFHVEGQWVAVPFFPDCKGFGQAISFSTAQHYRVSGHETSIPLNSPVARALGKLNANQTVILPGTCSICRQAGISWSSRTCGSATEARLMVGQLPLSLRDTLPPLTASKFNEPNFQVPSIKSGSEV